MFTVTKVQMITSTVCGHHDGLSTLARRAALQCEGNNIDDDFVVAILKNSNTVGHVPRDISCRRAAVLGLYYSIDMRSEVVHV